MGNPEVRTNNIFEKPNSKTTKHAKTAGFVAGSVILASSLVAFAHGFERDRHVVSLEKQIQDVHYQLIEGGLIVQPKLQEEENLSQQVLDAEDDAAISYSLFKLGWTSTLAATFVAWMWGDIKKADKRNQSL